jgi:four helix bundle protein
LGQSYKDLIAWQKAMQFVAVIYRETRQFPKEERYGLTNQLRRAAVSVPSNIAEGQARFSQKEFKHFLSQARGSLVEIETQLLISQSLGYLPAKSTQVLMNAAENSEESERTNCLNQDGSVISRLTENREPRTENWF